MTKEEQKDILEALKPGMFVKVKGARDGTGIREIIEVDNNPTYPKIVCRKWRRATFWKTNPLLGHVYIEPDNYMTTHMIDKITHKITIQDGGEYKFVDRYLFLYKIPIMDYIRMF